MTQFIPRGMTIYHSGNEHNNIKYYTTCTTTTEGGGATGGTVCAVTETFQPLQRLIISV